jgi:phenylacetate-CoA ligase
MYNQFLENIILPLGDFINKSFYIKQLKYWRKVDAFTEKQLENLQKKNLQKVLKNAVQNVEKYKDIKLEGENPFTWLKQFPILTKNDIRDSSELLISKKNNKKNLISYSSSGSSGIQSTVYMNKYEQSVLRGVLTHWWEWSGYRVGKPLVQTGMNLNRGLLKSIKDSLFNTIYLNAFSLSDKQLKIICKKLNNTNKYYLSGYASSLNVIAEYVLKNNYNIQLQAVISLGDKLFSHYRKNIEKAFNCKVFDTYGSNEGLMIAAQKDLEYLYILSPHVFIEVVNNDGKIVEDGKMGHLLVTRLDGFSMPLIRYKLGDLGIILPKDKYPKNREFNYPLLQQIVGRESDVVLLKDNKKLIVHSFTGIFEYVTTIKQFKVIQKNREGIIIEYITDVGFKKEFLETITLELQKHIQDLSFKIQYIEVDYIAPLKSGKPEIVTSYL